MAMQVLLIAFFCFATADGLRVGEKEADTLDTSANVNASAEWLGFGDPTKLSAKQFDQARRGSVTRAVVDMLGPPQFEVTKYEQDVCRVCWLKTSNPQSVRASDVYSEKGCEAQWQGSYEERYAMYLGAFHSRHRGVRYGEALWAGDSDHKAYVDHPRKAPREGDAEFSRWREASRPSPGRHSKRAYCSMYYPDEHGESQGLLCWYCTLISKHPFNR